MTWLDYLRTWYGTRWWVAVAEHWERHSPLSELLAEVRRCEAVYR